MALLLNKGLLPGTVLCNAKAVKTWFRSHDAESAGDGFAMWRQVYGELRMHLGSGGPWRSAVALTLFKADSDRRTILEAAHQVL